MKIREAIEKTDLLKHNTYSPEEKVAWLSQLDGRVKLMIIDTHEGGQNVPFRGYDETTDQETELLVPAPFDEIYIRWLEAQIDSANGDTKRYNNSITLYDTVWNNYSRYYTRTHMPLGRHFKYF